MIILTTRVQNPYYRWFRAAYAGHDPGLQPKNRARVRLKCFFAIVRPCVAGQHVLDEIEKPVTKVANGFRINFLRFSNLTNADLWGSLSGDSDTFRHFRMANDTGFWSKLVVWPCTVYELTVSKSLRL
jgi:hypothetical protein